jgi:hypothetical protein
VRIDQAFCQHDPRAIERRKRFIQNPQRPPKEDQRRKRRSLSLALREDTRPKIAARPKIKALQQGL